MYQRFSCLDSHLEVKKALDSLINIDIDNLEPDQMILFDQIGKYLNNGKMADVIKDLKPDNMLYCLNSHLDQITKSLFGKTGQKLIYSFEYNAVIVPPKENKPKDLKFLIPEVKEMYERAHMVIVSLASALISDTIYIVGDGNLDSVFLDTIYYHVEEFYFPKSMGNLLNIAFTFLNRSNDQFSAVVHEKFNTTFLTKTLSNINSRIARSITSDNEIDESILPSLVACLKMILYSISRYPKDIEKIDMVALIHEYAFDFAWMSRYPELCILLCKTIVELFNGRNLVYPDFYILQYPAFVSTLLKSDVMDVRTYAFEVVGKINAVNCYRFPLNFSEFLSPIKYFKEEYDTRYLKASLSACKSFLVNKRYAEFAHKQITENIEPLKYFYQWCNLSVKKSLIELFKAYLNCFRKLRITKLEPFKEAINTVTFLSIDLAESIEKQAKVQIIQCLYKFCSFISTGINDEVDPLHEILSFLILNLIYSRDKEIRNFSSSFTVMLPELTSPQQQGQEIQ